ncbi:hypothetical protein A5819_003532 [Enterococcus sp. 7E2_DIV0204]|uniref:hypothetical protein n=1 Tax=unclassified Enterococcus TaxID=2608891 RepID=UPI000A34CD8D|nr:MULTISPECIES: hypothetical protein [unclassified Enterococcus]OTN83982.1 hypothetical protein A5819_003532 [Enterococcus sp. 7E2_DIV0204]OTP47235.1 hypothetical protein A5884_003610 [Enterococcus sp. 7D2_DIV0200]
MNDEDYSSNQEETWRSSDYRLGSTIIFKESSIGEENSYEVKESEVITDSTNEENTLLNLLEIQQGNFRQATITALDNSIQNVLSMTLNLCLSVLPFLIAIIVLRKLLEKSIYSVFGIQDKFYSYNEKEYEKALQVMNLFSDYKKFQRKMKWYIWKNRWSSGKEFSDLICTIAESPYKEDTMFQYEVIQLFPPLNEINRLKKKELLEDVSRKVKKLNQNYWAVDF